LPLPVSALAFSPDGRLLAAGSQQPLVRRPAFVGGSQVLVWDFASGQLAHTFAGHGDAVYALAFSSNGQLLASGGLDTRIRLTDVNQAAPTQVLAGGHTSVVDLAFSRDGQTLYSLAAAFEGCYEACGSQPGAIPARDEPQPLRLWRAVAGQMRSAPPSKQDQPLYNLDLSPDGRLLAGRNGLGLLLVDAGTGQTLRQVRLDGPMGAVLFSPDGRYLVTTNDHHVLFLDPATGQPVATIDAHSAAIISLAISPDGIRLATSSGDGVLRIWQIMDGQP
jgi:WD40 repeat protein